MVDDLRNRGGEVDAAALAAQLGAPVALISAASGEGVEKVIQFLEGTAASIQLRTTPLAAFPILQDVPKCRAWASQVGRGSGYQSPAASKWNRRLDSVFLHPVGGPLVFFAVVVARLSDNFHRRQASDAGVAGRYCGLRELAWEGAARFDFPFPFDRRRLDRCWIGAGLSAADSVALSVYRHLGRLGLSGARRP